MHKDTFLKIIENIKGEVNFSQVAITLGLSYVGVRKTIEGERQNPKTQIKILKAAKAQLLADAAKKTQLANEMQW